MKFDFLRSAALIALLPLMIFSGCKGDVETNDRNDAEDVAAAGPGGESSEAGNMGSANAGAAATGAGSTGGRNDNATETPAPAASFPSKPTPIPSDKYTAKINRVDKAKGDSTKYNIEATFTLAQGNKFVINVLADKTGALLFSEPVESVPDYYYSHTTSFSYPGALSDLNVQVTTADGSRVLDTWDL